MSVGEPYLTLETGTQATISTLARKRAKKGRVFTLQIPPVPAAIQQRVREELQARDSISPERLHLKVITARLVDQQERVILLEEERLPQLQKRLQCALDDLEEQKNIKTKTRVRKIEEAMRQEYEEAKRQRLENWRQRIHEECREELEARKLTQQELKDEEQKDDGSYTGSRQNSDGATQDQIEEAPSVVAREQLTLCQQTLEALNESRSEMIWLLKQVIKAEEKRKTFETASKKPAEAKIQSSNQA